MHRKPRNNIDLNIILDDYTPPEGIFITASTKFQILTKILQELPTDERNIIILYAETASVREAGKRLGVSSSLIYQDIKNIKNKILKRYYAILESGAYNSGNGSAR